LGRPHHLYPKARLQLMVQERKRYLTELLHTHYGDTTISNTTINAKIDTLIWHIWAMAPGRNFVFKTAAKLLQIKTWLLLTGTHHFPIQRYHS